jgi:hypothetical protein
LVLRSIRKTNKEGISLCPPFPRGDFHIVQQINIVQKRKKCYEAAKAVNQAKKTYRSRGIITNLGDLSRSISITNNFGGSISITSLGDLSRSISIASSLSGESFKRERKN